MIYIYLLKSIKTIHKARLSLSKMLRGKYVDLIEATKEANLVINHVMNTERNDPSAWKELSEQGKQLQLWQLMLTLNQ